MPEKMTAVRKLNREKGLVVEDIPVPSSLPHAVLILNKKGLTSFCSITSIQDSYG